MLQKLAQPVVAFIEHGDPINDRGATSSIAEILDCVYRAKGFFQEKNSMPKLSKVLVRIHVLESKC
jgi:hypothetical protein